MYSTCLYCTRDLDKNEVLETLPIGRRVAFDAHKGRLWVVCRKCAKWNLVPFDTRLETIEDCERLYRDTAKRFATDNIGIAKVREGLELVRIGEPMRPEFASWRYGESYKKRRRRSILLVGGGSLAAATVATAGISALGAVGVSAFEVAVGSSTMAGFVLTAIERSWQRGMKSIGGVVLPHPESARPVRLGLDSLSQAVVSWEGGTPTLDVPIIDWDRTAEAHVSIAGDEFTAVGRRVVGGMNMMIGSGRDLTVATERLTTEKGDLSSWLRTITDTESRIGGRNASWRYPGLEGYARKSYTKPCLPLNILKADQRLAIEMWMNEDVERIYLEGELKLLEREWREADELAGIADKLAIDGTQDTDDS